LRQEFPLRRFLKCPTCGRRARGYRTIKPNGDTFDYYDCQDRACGFRVRAHDAHAAFVRLLRQVTPSEELLALFREAVRHAWAAKRTGLEAGREAGRKDVAKLEAEKAQLVTLMKRSAGKPALLEELERDFERVERELSLARMSDEVASFDRYDPEAVAEVCVGAILRVYELWDKWPVEAKSRIQRLVFPEGLGYDELIGNRTPRFSLLYATISDSHTAKSRMAPPTWRIANQVIEEMVRWYEVLKSHPLDTNVG
jgi:hypothetical protein